MPTILYLVHGMGCGTADGQPRDPVDAWSAPVVDAVRWIAGTFRLRAPTVLDPLPDQPPPDAADPAALWVVPISYHEVFDEFRTSSTQRAPLARQVGAGLLTDLEVD